MPETRSQFHRDDDSLIVRMAGEVIAQHLEKGKPLPPPPAIWQENESGIYTTENGEQRSVRKPLEQEIGSKRLQQDPCIIQATHMSRMEKIYWALHLAGGGFMGYGIDQAVSHLPYLGGDNFWRTLILTGGFTGAGLVWKLSKYFGEEYK